LSIELKLSVSSSPKTLEFQKGVLGSKTKFSIQEDEYFYQFVLVYLSLPHLTFISHKNFSEKGKTKINKKNRIAEV